MKTSCKYLICYDVETGGLPSKEKVAFLAIPLIEVAFCVIDMERMAVIEDFSMIFPYEYKDGLEYSQEAEAIHGITPEMQKSKSIPLKEIYKKCTNLFKKYKNPRQMCTLVGHNIVGFDNAFLDNFFSFMGDDLYKYVKFSCDTMQIAHMAFEESENYQLHTICDKLGIDLVDAHRASSDTYANALLMIEFIKRLRGVSSGEQQESAELKKINPFREKFAL